MSQGTLVAEGGADPRIGMVLQDRYRIRRKLGEGGMGAVYEGEHILIKRRVAIKCLHAHYASSPDIVARFHREALAATAIGHPNIIECTDMGRFPDGAFFMVLEFLDGRDWAADLAQSGPQPLGKVVHVMSQVCDALAAAHSKGIVHRDLKPENIFLIRRGSDPDFVKVLDFGISKMQDGGSDPDGPGKGKNLTRTGMAMGTPYFMAPEQAQGKRDVDHRADIYALGVILFQVLTGQYPFDDDSYPMLVVKICTQDPPPITRWRPDVPEEVQSLITRMLAKSPDDRPASCEEVKAALEPFRDRTQTPVLASDAPRTASLSPGTFGDAAATPSTTPAPSDEGPRAGTRPITLAATPSARASRTPAAPPEDEAPVEQLPTSRPKAPLVIGGAVAALLAVGVGVLATSGGEQETPPPTSVASAATQEPTAPRTAAAPSTATDTSATGEPGEPRPPEPAEAPTAEPATTPTRPVPTVTVQIQTEPEDAEVYLDDRRIPNPFDGDLPQSTEPRNLRVQREGYVTQVQDLVLEFPQRVRVRLTRGSGVQDRSTAGRTAPPRREARAGASQDAPPAATVTPPPAREPDPPPQRVAEPPRPTEPAPSSTTEPEGGRRTLKNPFGAR